MVLDIFVVCRFAEIDIRCHRCSVSLCLDGVLYVSGACFVRLSVLCFAAFIWVFIYLWCILRGINERCSPCRISRHLHGISLIFSIYWYVQNPCKIMAATSLLREMRSFWFYTCDFARYSIGDNFGGDFLGSWRGGVPCGKQLAGKMAGTRALRYSHSFVLINYLEEINLIISRINWNFV